MSEGSEEVKDTQADAVAETTKPADSKESTLPDNTVVIEDSGTLKKKITITVPRARIDAKLGEMFGELSESAVVPGFRIGHAPRRLIEKRFGKEIGNDVRNALVGEAIGQASEKHNLRTLGEPNLELDKIVLPDSGDMTFGFEIEVAPEIALPELKAIKVNRPVIKIDDARIDAAITNIARNNVRYEETTDAAAQNDAVLAGVKITGEGLEPVERHGLTLHVAPGQVEGLPLLELGNVLTGKKAGDTATLTAKAPEAHPNEAWRGKDLNIELTVSQVRHMVLPEINEEYAKNLGFETLDQLRKQVSMHLEERVKSEIQQAMREQICKYLLDNTKFDLPEGVVARHAERLVMRRSVDLMQQGVPQEMIQENLTKLRAAASEQAVQDMRLAFILGKYADDEKIVVADEEINARIADMARQYNRRPERMRQEMESDGSLAVMVDRMHEEKSLDKLLELAEITDVADVAPQEEPKIKKSKAKDEAKQDDTAEAKADDQTDASDDKPAKKKKAKKASQEDDKQ
jgi:trigger factor